MNTLNNTALEDILDLQDITYEKPSKAYLLIKRIFDVFFAIIAIILLSPVMLVIACAIKLEDGGPVIHNRMCVKPDGTEFKMHKFRSMKQDADTLEKWLSPDEIKQFYAEAKIDNDPRITKCGKVIRKLSIDELPQLFCIVEGTMSFVGPRPITEPETVHYKDKLSMLLEATPGLTGNWQVNGRSDCTYNSGRRQGLELYYVANRCMSLDIKIFFKTFSVVFSREGAR